MTLEDPTASAVILSLCMLVFLAIPLCLVTSGQRRRNRQLRAASAQLLHPKQQARRGSRAGSIGCSCGAVCEHVVLVQTAKAQAPPAASNATARRGSADGEAEMALLSHDSDARPDIARTNPATPADSMQHKQPQQPQQQQQQSNSPQGDPTGASVRAAAEPACPALDLAAHIDEEQALQQSQAQAQGESGRVEREQADSGADQAPRGSAAKQVRFQSPQASPSDSDVPGGDQPHGDGHDEDMSVHETRLSLDEDQQQQEQPQQQQQQPGDGGPEFTAVCLSELIPPVRVQQAQGPAVIEDAPFHCQSDNFARAELEPSP